MIATELEVENYIVKNSDDAGLLERYNCEFIIKLLVKLNS